MLSRSGFELSDAWDRQRRALTESDPGLRDSQRAYEATPADKEATSRYAAGLRRAGRSGEAAHVEMAHDLRNLRGARRQARSHKSLGDISFRRGDFGPAIQYHDSARQARVDADKRQVSLTATSERLGAKPWLHPDMARGPKDSQSDHAQDLAHLTGAETIETHPAQPWRGTMTFPHETHRDNYREAMKHHHPSATVDFFHTGREKHPFGATFNVAPQLGDS